MSATFQTIKTDERDGESGESGVSMSFLEHLDEFRKRLVRSILFVLVAFCLCWGFSDRIYNFLAAPAQTALAETNRREFSTKGLSGDVAILSLDNLKEGDAGRFVFDQPTTIGVSTIPAGATVMAQVARDQDGQFGLFTTEQLFSGNAIVPVGIRLPLDFTARPGEGFSNDERLIVTTAVEPFTLYVTVSLYAAIALAVPFLLWQIWSFIAPGLYAHERTYAMPFIFLSTISFVIGAMFAYYILFPPAVRYLLGLGHDFRLMLRASDYFDFITLIMISMGVVFQMPAVTYVLARIGIVSAPMLIGAWRTASIIILIVAALVSPTGDIPNLMLFAAPMFVLYAISIFIAWVFGNKRQTEN